MKRLYPFAPLAALMGLSEHQAAIRLGLSGKTEQQYRRDGMSEKVADRRAVKAGLHPFEVWPDMAEDALIECAADDCTERFAPTRKGHRYHSRKCAHRVGARLAARRRYRTDPEFRAKRLAAVAAYRAENARALAIKERLYREQNRAANAARQREYYRRNREAVLQRQRRYDAKVRVARRAQQRQQEAA